MPSEVGVLGGVRALVLDPDSHVSLAACRALGRAGVVAEVGGDRFAGIAERSRYVRATHALPDARGPAAPYAEALRSLIDTRRIDVVVTTDDATIARLDSIDLPVASVPGLGAARRSLVDKAAGLAELCASCGVAYPETWTVPAKSDGRDLVAAALPAVVKARTSATATADGVACARGATPVDSVEGGARRIARLRERGLEPIVQRRVARAASSALCCCDAEARWSSPMPTSCSGSTRPRAVAQPPCARPGGRITAPSGRSGSAIASAPPRATRAWSTPSCSSMGTVSR